MSTGAVVLLVALAGATWTPIVAWASQTRPASQESHTFSDFRQRVKDYLKLHQTVDTHREHFTALRPS